jgi:uncharacterized peroxidase-related enzyme
MTWISTVEPEQADDRLAASYRRVTGPNGEIDNILKAHSLRPHTLDGHMALYKNALHHVGNQLSKALLEGLGVYVSLLNGCDYCVAHHAEGLRRQLGDDQLARAILAALRSGHPQNAVSAREVPLYAYAEVLTQRPTEMTEESVQAIRDAGWSDGEILEANQVISYFAYANRTVLGLGVCIDGEVLGLSPRAGGEKDWHHG